MRIRLGHSPDPDDAFMVWALSEGLVDTGDLQIELVPADIQTLNEWARDKRLEVSAVSLHAYTYVADEYRLMSCGASFGEGYGPVVVSLPGKRKADILRGQIAVPGAMTTAYCLARMAWGEFSVLEVPFHKVIDMVKTGQAGAGIIIHEDQLCYQDVGLDLCCNLAKWWSDNSGGLPLPLGVMVVRRDLGERWAVKIARLFRASIEYGLEHRGEALEYALQFSTSSDVKLCDRFISMYVNDMAVDFGSRGEEAIRSFLRKGAELGLWQWEVPCDYVLR